MWAMWSAKPQMFTPWFIAKKVYQPLLQKDGWDFGGQNWGRGRAGLRETNILVEK